MAIEHVLIEVHDTVVARRNLRQEWDCPRKSCPKDDMVDSRFGSAVFKMHGSIFAADVRDWRSPLDLGMLECFIAEVGVVAAADYGMNGRLCAIH